MTISPEAQEYIDTLKTRIMETERDAYEDFRRYDDEHRRRVRDRMERCYADLQAPRAQLDAFLRVLAQAECHQTMFMVEQIQPLDEAGKVRLLALNAPYRRMTGFDEDVK